MPEADLETLESGDPRWHSFSHVALVGAVLYAKRAPGNPLFRSKRALELAIRIGDLLCKSSERAQLGKHLNQDRDIYVWLETYRLLQSTLGPERAGRWREQLNKNIAELVADVEARKNFPGYQSPYIGTSPNHFALWASTIYLAGQVFGNTTWQNLGKYVLHRFAVEEQSPDGFWGEHERTMPTAGYCYNTDASMALYAEWSNDPAAIKALRLGLDFHKFFTYPDGSPVELLDDRNRYTLVAGWGASGASTWPDATSPPGGNDESASKGHFGFSRFPDGRRYAQLLAGYFREGLIGLEDLGRLAQDALYYHKGPAAAIPQDTQNYSRQLSVPAGLRKTGPWSISLSGLISTQAVTNQFYLDRQAHLSIHHDRVGLVISGANSKRQPELATLMEILPAQVVYMPISSRLQMSKEQDRLSLAYNTFFADLLVPPPSGNEVRFSFMITGRGDAAAKAELNLQLCLKTGQTLETASGKRVLLGTETVQLSSTDIGGWIRHHGWKLIVDPAAQLRWPVYPHNPYTNSPEKIPQHAVGRLTVPLNLRHQSEDWTVLPREQQIAFTLRVQ